MFFISQRNNFNQGTVFFTFIHFFNRKQFYSIHSHPNECVCFNRMYVYTPKKY